MWIAMSRHRLHVAWFLFLQVIWPTYDTFCDIGLSVYCLYHGLRAWGIAMTLPILSNLVTSISAYIRKRRLAKTELGPAAVWTTEGFALPLLIWPQVQASRVGGMMWRRERGWQRRKRQFVRNEGTIESILEGVAQCYIAALIIIQKYVEQDENYGYRAQDYTGEDRESFGVITLIFIVISSAGSLVTGIFGIYGFLLGGPLKIMISQGILNKILLFVTIFFGMFSRFGSLAVVFLFSTSFEHQEGAIAFLKDLLAYTVLILSFTGIQLLLSLIPLMSFGPKRFFNLIFSFPHILIVPLVTPFTFGLTCDSGCCCHCCCCCGCSKPRLALSRSLSLVNHIVTLLLMIPPVIFFHFFETWDIIAIQACIAMIGILAAPILLFQPGRITTLGVLDPDNVQQQFIAQVEGGGCVFRLGQTEEEQPFSEDELEEGNEAEIKNLVAVNSPGNSPNLVVRNTTVTLM